MASYYDVADENDLELLPKSLRAHEDIDVLATEAEADVIRHFTRAPQPTALDTYGYPGQALKLDDARYVYLRGYVVDSAAVVTATYPNIADAIRRTVAIVLAHKIRIRDLDPGVASKGNQRSTTTWKVDATDTFPRGWKRWLEPHSTLPESFVI